MGCPCRDDGNQPCDLGFSCDSALKICVSCSGQLGCPCPCNAQSTCNEETGLCELSSLSDAFLPSDLSVETQDMNLQDHDLHIDMQVLDLDMQVLDMQALDMQALDMQALDMQVLDLDMQVLDQDINDFSVDMMIINLLGISNFYHPHLVQGALLANSNNYIHLGIISSGSSFGHSTHYTLQSTLNP